MSNMEIQRWIPALRASNNSVYESIVSVQEQDAFLDCFGNLDLYNALIDKKIDYSSVEPFSEGTSYSLDDLVEHNLVVYKSKVNTNTSLLHVEADWEEAPVFENQAKYEECWNNAGMATWLANVIWKASIAFQTYQVSGKGPVKHFEDSGERTVDSKEYYTLVKSIETNVRASRRIMLNYINKYGSDFGITDTSCDENATGYIGDLDDSRVAFYD